MDDKGEPDMYKPRLHAPRTIAQARRGGRRRRTGLAAIGISVVLGLTAFGTPVAGASTPALPNSMASTGDSITRAFDIDPFHFLVDSPQQSWSTGTDSRVNSQYRRILAANSGISGHVFNDAKTGAKMTDLDGQVKSAASQNVQYLTVLMGANDLCTSSASTMTATATFQSQFQQAMADFTAADPTANIFVSSAQSTWSLFGICQSMLSLFGTDASRQLVVNQEAADNNVLATVCGQYTHCKWDGYAIYNKAFVASDVSTADYFHPSQSGQNTLATTTWGASYWPTVL
jgi:lysophospholipase L1-like esterase